MPKDINKLTTPEDIDYTQPLKNAKYEAFCQQYQIDHNATQACIRAGYSTKQADSKGGQLYRLVQIQGRMKVLQATVAEKCGVTPERLMREWEKIGFANIQDVVGIGNKIRSISQLTPEKAAAVESIQTTKTGVKITFHSKTTALRNMGESVGFYEKHGGNLADAMVRLLDRIDGKTRGLPKDD